MPIPATTSADIFLRTLLGQQVEDFEARISVEEILTSLPNNDVHEADQTLKVTPAIRRDIEFLEHHRLLTFWPDNPHVRLTPLGVFTALLFDAPQNASPERAD